MSLSDVDPVAVSENQLWFWGGLPLCLATVVLWVTSQGGPLLHSLAVDLSPVHAGYFGSLLIGLCCFLFNLLVAIPIVSRRRGAAGGDEGATGLGPLWYLPLPLSERLPHPPEGNYRQSLFYRVLIGLGALGFAFLPAAFTVHGLKKVAGEGLLWVEEEAKAAFAVSEKLHPLALADGSGPPRDQVAVMLARVKRFNWASTLATPLAVFESCGRGPFRFVPHYPFWIAGADDPCDVLRLARLPRFATDDRPSRDKILLASREGDIVRSLSGLDSDEIDMSMSTTCLRNRQYCKGVDTWPHRLGVWYFLLGLPSMVAVASTLWFWGLVFWPSPRGPLRRMLTALRPPAPSALSQQASALRQQASDLRREASAAKPLAAPAKGRHRRLRRVVGLLALSALFVASWYPGSVLSSRMDLPAYYGPGVLALIALGVLCERRWRRPLLIMSLVLALIGVGLLASIETWGGLLIVVAGFGLVTGLYGLLIWRGNQTIGEQYGPVAFGEAAALRDGRSAALEDASGAGPEEVVAFEKQVSRLVHELLIGGDCRLPAVPQLYRLSDVRAPMALATGRDRRHAAIGVSVALAHWLDETPGPTPSSSGAKQACEARLKAILAHEIAHIEHYDTIRRLVVNGLVGAIGWLAALHAGSAATGEGRDAGHSRLWRLPLAFLATGMLAFLLPALSAASAQTREFAADRRAAELCGGPGGLIDALRSLGRWQEANQTQREGRSGPSLFPVAHLMTVPPLEGAACGGLFRSHPTIAERIRRLETQWELPEGGAPGPAR